MRQKKKHKIRWAYAQERTGVAPRLAHSDDAGFDLTYCGHDPVFIAPNETIDIPTGICVELPPFTWAMVTGRSSTFRKRNLMMPLGVIDNGYRGELFAVVRNIGGLTEVVHPGERVAQLIIVPMTSHRFEWEHCAKLADSVRGTSGFGSTGA